MNFNFNVFPELHTDRLTLREIHIEDANSIFKILSDPAVVKYDTFELYTNIRQAEGLIEYFRKSYDQKQAIFWGISINNNPELIGFCKCEIEIPKVRADLGYNLRSDYWNKGIMTESLNAIINFTLGTIDVNRIEAAVSVENIASVKVLEKLGFKKEGILRQRSYWKGNYHDMTMLSVLKEEWLVNFIENQQ